MSPAQERVSPPDSDPQDLLDRLRHAWNAGDAYAYAELFSEDATYVIWRGDVLTGRAQIQQAHRDLFTRSPSTMRVHVVDTRLLDEGTAIVLTVGGTGNEGSITYDKLQTLVMVRRDQGWMISAFHNTGMSDRAKQSYRSL
jgi:uncharacterized protein (TIGR02246 family)